MRVVPDDQPFGPPAATLEQPERLAALRATGLMADDPAGALDHVARAAARLLEVPVALVSLVDDRRQRFAGRAGARGPLASLRETPLAYSVCQHVVARAAPVAIADAAGDPRVRDHAAVREYDVRAYLGVPLTTADGATLGALCAVDYDRHDWNAEDVERLRDLAPLAVAELERRAALGAARESEERFRAAFELHPWVAWLADADGRVAELSGRWQVLTGLAPEAGVGSGWLDAVHGDDAPRVRAAWERAVRTGAPLDVEYRLRAAEGAYRWVRARAGPQRDAHGRIVWWHGSIEDRHDRVLAEREHEALLLASRGAADGLWSWELATGAAFHSPRLGELLGYPPGGLPDARAALDALFHPDDLPRHHAALAAHLNRRAPYDVEVRLRHRDGGWRWFRLRGRAEWDASGRPVRMAGSAGDVTERRTTEAALRASQAHLALLFARAAVGLAELAPDGRFVRVNAELCRIVGRTPEEMSALGFADVTHPDDVARSVTAVSAVLAVGGSARLEKRYLRPDGTAVVAESVVSRLEAEDGGEPTLLAVTADLTAWRAAEAALRESETRFRQLADNASEMFWLVELGPTLMESRVIYMNPAYTRITGRALASVVESPVLGFDLVAPEDLPRVLEAMEAAVAGESRAFEFRLAAPAEAPKFVRSRVFPIRDADGRVVRLGGLTDDVTAQRTLEERLRQAHKLEAVGRLAGGVAHDFNNLLTVVSANLEFAQESVAEELAPDHPVAADLAAISHAAARARALVRQLLAFSRRQPVEPRPVRLGALVRGAEALLRRTLGEENALAVEVAADDPTVHADPGQLEQVLLNLAVNARDAMTTSRHGHPGTGGTLTVAVDTVTAPGAPAESADEPAGRAERRWARLRVSDTGHGMDAATHARLFEPFFTTKEVGAGTGLGLASAHGIVSQAGGSIAVESAPGEGATLTILLPAVDDLPAADEVGRAPGAAGGLAARATLLLVEDEASVRATVRRMLERAGYAVRAAENGAEALDVWAAHRDQIVGVVTDVRMPALGGRALADRLRAEAPGLPVVFVSGYTDDAPTMGPDSHAAFVMKPFVSETLLAAVGRVLSA